MIRPNRSSRLALLILLLGAISQGWGCSKSSDSASERDERRGALVDAGERAEEEGAGADDADALTEVFGLPVPPNSEPGARTEHRVRVTAPLNLNELAEFFERELVDFELLPSRNMLRAVGLRSYMPEIRAFPHGPFSHIEYIQPRPQPRADSGEEQADDEPKREVIISGRDLPSQASTPRYQKGDPILERTPDGELLAPGARWGEPYTPPTGSPLDLKRNRSNFGRPFGQWIAH